MPNNSAFDYPVCSVFGWHFPVLFIQLDAKQPINMLDISLLTNMVFERTDALVYHPFRFQSVSILVFEPYAIWSLTSFALYLLLIFNFSNCSMPVLGSVLFFFIFGTVPYSSLISNSFMNMIKVNGKIQFKSLTPVLTLASKRLPAQLKGTYLIQWGHDKANLKDC